MIRPFAILLVLIALGSPSRAQTYADGDIFVADRGITQNGSDGEVRRYSQTGEFIGTLPALGSGQLRSMAFALNGDLYIARGNQVRRYIAASGFSVDPAVIASGTKAQGVAVHPVTQNVWCSFGTTASQAIIVEVTATGMPVQSLTDAALVHPRSLSFSFDGSTLYCSNAMNGDVLSIDPVTGVVQQLIDLSGQGFFVSHIVAARTFDNGVYAVGDFGGTQTVALVLGTPGTATGTNFIDYSSSTDFTAPAGGCVDSSGNVLFANRDANMSVPGMFAFTQLGATRPIAPFSGAEHINPIDVAIQPRQLDITLFSPVGTNADGVARVVPSATTTPIGIQIDAPDFPGHGYAMFFSNITSGVCDDGNPTRPTGLGLRLGMDDMRRAPLEDDGTLAASIGFIFTGGAGVLSSVCAGETDGSVIGMIGGLDAAGRGFAGMNFPATMCLMGLPGIEFFTGFAVAILDMQPTNSPIALFSPVATCLVFDTLP